MDIGEVAITLARSMVLKLLMYYFNTTNGIKISADMPYGQTGLTNISRPDGVRTYYGRNLSYFNPLTIERVTYGPTDISGVLSIDPSAFSTKEMSTEMFDLGNTLNKFVKK